MKFRFTSALACAAALSFLPAAQAQTVQVLPADAGAQPLYLAADAPACPIPGQFLEGWQSWDDLYAPFSTYSMTPQQQAAYLAMIHSIWQGPFLDINPEEVNDEMAEVTNIVLWEIANCAKHIPPFFIGPALTTIHQKFSGEFSEEEKRYFVQVNQAQILTDLNGIRLSWLQKGCIPTAAANWRSMLEAAYWGEY